MPFCKYCGIEFTADARFCPNCGAPVATQVAPPPTGIPRQPEQSPLKMRPFGISILAVLEGIGSFFTLIAGIALIGLAAFLSTGG
ncbi:zinc-ribbon domain-containing protein, partial [Candidatus Bathyarchaeota archaeon]|nr:zinc-ribbon domain-containing protein [Candidatus Bathyarchaeota archaeon]